MARRHRTGGTFDDSLQEIVSDQGSSSDNYEVHGNQTTNNVESKLTEKRSMPMDGEMNMGFRVGSQFDLAVSTTSLDPSSSPMTQQVQQQPNGKESSGIGHSKTDASAPQNTKTGNYRKNRETYRYVRETRTGEKRESDFGGDFKDRNDNDADGNGGRSVEESSKSSLDREYIGRDREKDAFSSGERDSENFAEKIESQGSAKTDCYEEDDNLSNASDDEADESHNSSTCQSASTAGQDSTAATKTTQAGRLTDASGKRRSYTSGNRTSIDDNRCDKDSSKRSGRRTDSEGEDSDIRQNTATSHRSATSSSSRSHSQQAQRLLLRQLEPSRNDSSFILREKLLKSLEALQQCQQDCFAAQRRAAATEQVAHSRQEENDELLGDMQEILVAYKESQNEVKQITRKGRQYKIERNDAQEKLNRLKMIHEASERDYKKRLHRMEDSVAETEELKNRVEEQQIVNSELTKQLSSIEEELAEVRKNVDNTQTRKQDASKFFESLNQMKENMTKKLEEKYATQLTDMADELDECRATMDELRSTTVSQEKTIRRLNSKLERSKSRWQHERDDGDYYSSDDYTKSDGDFDEDSSVISNEESSRDVKKEGEGDNLEGGDDEDLYNGSRHRCRVAEDSFSEDEATEMQLSEPGESHAGDARSVETNKHKRRSRSKSGSRRRRSDNDRQQEPREVHDETNRKGRGRSRRSSESDLTGSKVRTSSLPPEPRTEEIPAPAVTTAVSFVEGEQTEASELAEVSNRKGIEKRKSAPGKVYFENDDNGEEHSDPEIKQTVEHNSGGNKKRGSAPLVSNALEGENKDLKGSTMTHRHSIGNCSKIVPNRGRLVRKASSLRATDSERYMGTLDQLENDEVTELPAHDYNEEETGFSIGSRKGKPAESAKLVEADRKSWHAKEKESDEGKEGSKVSKKKAGSNPVVTADSDQLDKLNEKSPKPTSGKYKRALVSRIQKRVDHRSFLSSNQAESGVLTAESSSSSGLTSGSSSGRGKSHGSTGGGKQRNRRERLETISSKYSDISIESKSSISSSYQPGKLQVTLPSLGVGSHKPRRSSLGDLGGADGSTSVAERSTASGSATKSSHKTIKLTLPIADSVIPSNVRRSEWGSRVFGSTNIPK